MAKTTTTIEVTGEDPGVYHIPGQHNMQQTLCGFVDCSFTESHDAEDHPCNCKDCISALKKIQALRFPAGYFAAV